MEESARSNKVMLVLFSVVMMFIVVGTCILLYQIFHPPDPSLVAVAACDGGGSSTCGEGKVCDQGKCVAACTADSCGEGDMCVKGRCVAWSDSLPACQSGQSCDAKCSCLKPFSCRGGVCVQDGAAQSSACSSPAIQEALKHLVAACESAGGRGMDCPQHKWEDFVMNDARFDEIVTNFPDALTFHFPGGKPYVMGEPATWPSAQEEAHYLQALARMRAALDAAKLIFLIGRASPGGVPGQNERLGHARMAYVRSLLKNLYTDPAERNAVNGKILNFGLGEARQLRASFFAGRFSGRLVTWDADSDRRLENAVTNPTAITDADKWWAVNVVNQVAFLIAVPCDGGDVAR